MCWSVGYFIARTRVYLHPAKSFVQFVDQFSRNPREIVHEIERVFDLVCNPGGQLAE
jgi:hypothetical protein